MRWLFPAGWMRLPQAVAYAHCERGGLAYSPIRQTWWTHASIASQYACDDTLDIARVDDDRLEVRIRRLEANG